MKKLILLLSLVGLFFTGVVAKDDAPKEPKLETEEKKVFDGVILKKSGKTLKTKFEFTVSKFDNVLDVEAIQKEVNYLDSAGVKHVLSPEDVAEIRFTHDSTEYRMLACPNKIKLGGGALRAPKIIFLKLELDGKLRLLRYYESSTSTSPTGKEMKTVTRRYVLRKSNDDMIKPESDDFKKDMSEFFEDCQSMVFKISKQEFTKKDMQKIVRFYNAECAK